MRIIKFCFNFARYLNVAAKDVMRATGDESITFTIKKDPVNLLGLGALQCECFYSAFKKTVKKNLESRLS